MAKGLCQCEESKLARRDASTSNLGENARFAGTSAITEPVLPASTLRFTLLLLLPLRPICNQITLKSHLREIYKDILLSLH